MQIIKNKGNAFDYVSKSRAVIVLSTMADEYCNAIITEQASTYKSMADMLDKISGNIPCADQYGSCYFFFIPFDATHRDTAFTTLREAFMIMGEVGADEVVMGVYGERSDVAALESMLADYAESGASRVDCVLLLEKD